MAQPSSPCWNAKALGMLGCFLLAVGGCWLARWLEQARGNSRTRDLMLDCGNTLAAGILLAASLTHMLPDAMDALQGLTSFPLAPLLAGTAFCFLVILGEVVGSCMPTRETPHSQTACMTYQAGFAIWPRWELMPPHGCNEAEEKEEPPEAEPTLMCESSPSGEQWTQPNLVRERSSSIDGKCCGQVHQSASSAKEPSELPGDPKHNCHSHSACCRVHRHSDAQCSTEAVSKTSTPNLLHEPFIDKSVATHRHHSKEQSAISSCHIRAVHTGPIEEVKSFLLFFALCFHSVMEGLGLGSAQDGLLIPVLLAILAHKGLAAFALGCSLTNSNLPRWKFWIFVLIFSLGTPIGCILGILFVQVGSVVNQSIAAGICIGLASGTFLQISTMELLPRVLAEERNKVASCCALTFGFMMMSLLAIWS